MCFSVVQGVLISFIGALGFLGNSLAIAILILVSIFLHAILILVSVFLHAIMTLVSVFLHAILTLVSIVLRAMHPDTGKP